MLSLYTTRHTTAIYNPLTALDAGLAAGQGALIAVASQMVTAGVGATIGAALRVAYKINELILNPVFSFMHRLVGGGICLGLTRRIVEVVAAAALTSVALPYILQGAPVALSTCLLFSFIESVRPISVGGFQLSVD